MSHNNTCIRVFQEYNKYEEEFWRANKHACKSCAGLGGKYYSYDPSPSGVSLGPGHLDMFDPCEACEGNEILPTCALCGQIILEDGTKLCRCNTYMEGLYPPPECWCYEENENV